MSFVKKGNFVEYTDNYHQHYPPKDETLIKYGIAIEDSMSHDYAVIETLNEGIKRVQHIHAYAWMGWTPDELQQLIERKPELWNYDSPYED